MILPSPHGSRSDVSLSHIAAIAFPMIVSQGSEMTMLFFNRHFVFTSFFTGIVGYVSALAAQYHGAGDTTRVMILSGVPHWLLAVTAFILIRIVVLSPVAVWRVSIGFVVSLGVSMWLRHRFGSRERIGFVEAAPAP